MFVYPAPYIFFLHRPGYCAAEENLCKGQIPVKNYLDKILYTPWMFLKFSDYQIKDNDKSGSLMDIFSKESLQKLGAFSDDCLKKAGLVDLNEKLKELDAK